MTITDPLGGTTLLVQAKSNYMYAGKMKFCIAHGLDFEIYKLGPKRIKKMIQRKFGIELEIEGKDLHTITKEAQEIVYI